MPEQVWSQVIDSLDTMPSGRYFRQVECFHPVLLQSRVYPEMAEAEVQQARGAFDPKLGLEQRQKNFDDKTYWDDLYPSLKVPTWLGADLKLDYLQTEGEFLNPEQSVPEDGLIGLGITLPVGRNLFIDARRADLRQAKLMRDLRRADQLQMANNLRLKAALAYVEWYRSYRLEQLQREAVEVTRDQNEYVFALIEAGETAGIDSLKAAAQLSKRQIEYREAQVKRQNATLGASVYIWDSSGQALFLEERTQPGLPFMRNLTPPGSDALDTLVEAARRRNPKLNQLRTKNRQLEIDRQLATENLKPVFDVSFTWLHGGSQEPQEWSGATIDQDYKMAISASMPALLRKERGKLNLTQLKLLENRLAQKDTERKVANELRQFANEWNNLEGQLSQQRELVSNYYDLLEAEREKFGIGESDLLLVNLRLQQWVDSRQKEVALEAKLYKARCYTFWSAGFSPFYPELRISDPILELESD